MKKGKESGLKKDMETCRGDAPKVIIWTVWQGLTDNDSSLVPVSYVAGISLQWNQCSGPRALTGCIPFQILSTSICIDPTHPASPITIIFPAPILKPMFPCVIHCSVQFRQRSVHTLYMQLDSQHREGSRQYSHVSHWCYVSIPTFIIELECEFEVVNQFNQ